MRILLILIVLAASLWGGYWFVGASALESSTQAWLQQRRAEGWQADAQVDVRGFPNRFDLTLDKPAMADPDTGVAWAAPFFQLLAMSWQPNHVIAIWPDTQTIQTPLSRLTVNTEKMQGSLVFDADSDLALGRSVIEIDRMALTAEQGWTADLDSAQFSVRRIEEGQADAPGAAKAQGAGPAATYQIDLDADDLRLPPQAVAALDPSGRLPERIGTLSLKASVGFDRPWDRRAIEDSRPQPRRINLTGVRANWGQLDLRAAGDLEVDAEGIPEGRVTVKAQNWREILALAVNAGTVPRGMAGTIESVLGMLAGSTGDTNTLDVPITFAGGRMMFGPIPLGMAPRLILR
ncbi:hypothetical protein BV394_05615 [Brevirhabdus pacifica]|uniref:Uncharacterized protein n=1 Tax=Brevirhabdus pacifica TaxID=1267768 RepID=A0A1U7DH81_9RHOB|nr:DUF2125 domain-containing protein [Brevirhabdus pacifica]APX89259.1 hypothetical protein BV394_05615 [Brevirhabdus pacifica]OWU76696.1 hypothetical protein ATO5_10670 [Loktanella sp. 22II-4b]PJJ86132.1 hypothetical protein CLV77_0667 [Brevirhabdus pacifica]